MTYDPISARMTEEVAITSDQCNNDLRDVVWETPFEYQCTPKSTPFQSSFVFKLHHSSYIMQPKEVICCSQGGANVDCKLLVDAMYAISIPN
jgi:hypothetical protein